MPKKHLLPCTLLICLIFWLSPVAYGQNPLFSAPQEKRDSALKDTPIAPATEYRLKWQWQVWQPFRNVIARTADWQRTINRKLSQAIKLKNNPMAIWTLVGLSFLYGVLHAVGPGHGKFITSAYYLSHRISWSEVALTSTMLAFVQALSAVGLVTVLALILETSTRLILRQTLILEGVSYALLVLLGVAMLWRIWKETVCNHAHYLLLPKDKHQHEAQSQKSVSEGRLFRSSWVTMLGMSLAVGLRPCAGAVLVLLFAWLQEVYWAGVLAAVAMGAGVAIALTALGLGIVTSRYAAAKLKFVQNWLNASWVPALQRMGMSFGALLIMLMGVLLLAGTLERI